METPEENFVNGCQRTNRLSLMRLCYQSLLSLHLPQWLLWPLFLCFPVYSYLFLVQKRTSLHFSRKFPQCSLEIGKDFKTWDICAPESKKWLFTNQNWRQSRWVGGHSNLLKRIPIRTVVHSPLQFYKQSYSFAFVNCHWCGTKVSI